MEEVRINKALNPKTYKLMPLDQIGLALPLMSSQDAAAVFRMREKDFGKNPEELIKLLKAAEQSPTLKAAIQDSKLIQSIEKNEITFNRKNLNKVRELLTNEKGEATLDLKNTVTVKFNSKIRRTQEAGGQNIYKWNPKAHQRDSIEDLTTFLTTNEALAYHFLRQPRRQQELCEKPILIAKMIALGDANLQRTLHKERVLEWDGLNADVKNTLGVFLETKKYLNDPEFKKNPLRGELNRRLEAMVREPDGPTLSPAAVAQLNQDVKQTVIAEIQTALNRAPLNDGPEGAALKEKLNSVTALMQTDWNNPLLKKESFSAALKDPAMNDALELNQEVKATAEKVTLLREIKSAVEHPLLQENKDAAILAEKSSTLSHHSDVKEIQKLRNEATQMKNAAIAADKVATQQKIAVLTQKENTQDKKAAQSTDALHKKKWPAEEKPQRKKKKVRRKKKTTAPTSTAEKPQSNAPPTSSTPTLRH